MNEGGVGWLEMASLMHVHLWFSVRNLYLYNLMNTERLTALKDVVSIRGCNDYILWTTYLHLTPGQV
jgi:hypothetical protein